ncbi:hypothetical protein ABZ638_05375 [Streptomyces sp. NPDC007107]|uniref:hypothetical protein n=1 Tax=Streptomyces sp. NPDC007107 TaxID=3156915 RepID=UPI00340C4083
MALGVVVAAGAGLVLFQPDHREPALSVPDRVCQEAVPGTHVKALLPRTGVPFQEERAVDFVVGGPEELGRCDLSGGGTDLEVTYKMVQEADFTWESVQRETAKPGRTLIWLGEARGYTGSDRAALFVDCPSGEGRKDVLEVSVGVEPAPEAEAGDRTAELSALAADVARVIGHELKHCEGASRLPYGPPQPG